MSFQTVTNDGGWCWFQDPRAIRNEGMTYIGWITRFGDIEIGQYDHSRGTVTTKTLHTDYERDDHNDPTFAVRPDGCLIVFYTKHGGPAVNYRISEEPGDVSAFGPELRIEPGTDPSVTYPSPRWIDDDLHLFLRNNGLVVDVISRDGGETWNEQRELISTGGDGWCVYSKLSRPRNGEVHLGLTHAMGGTDDPHLHVYHARFDGDTLRTSNGTELGHSTDGSLPVSIYDTTGVYDSKTTGDDAWIWDCSIAGDVPQVVYAQLVSPDEHRYRYARWTNGGWDDELLCHGGTHIITGEDNDERYYSGGIVLDHDEPGVCYASVGSHDSSALLRLERLDDGWRMNRITSADVQNVRPVVPWNRHPGFRVCWLRGRYTHFDPRWSDDDGAAFQTTVVSDGVE